MELSAIVDSETFRWLILPLLIFAGRVMDVTLGTIRIMFVSRGDRLLAPMLGFFEVLIWITAIGQIMKHMDNFYYYIVYAGGFAAGNFLGIIIEDKLALGKLAVRIITREDSTRLISQLRRHKFGTTIVPALGKTGEVAILFTVVNRKDIKQAIDIIETCNPGAFYTIEDTRNVSSGVFRPTKGLKRLFMLRSRQLMRKRRRQKKGK